jgi:UDP-glucuronate decarboxylase
MAEHDGRVVSNFIVQALKGDDITIYGDGLQTRSFCYVSDLVAGAKSFLLYDGAIDSPINLGNDREFFIRDLAELVMKKTESVSKVSFLPLPKDDPKKRKPDLSLAAQILNYTPEVELEEGISRTIVYFNEILK